MGCIKHTTVYPHEGDKPTQLPPRTQHTHMALLKTLQTHSAAGAHSFFFSPFAEAALDGWLCGQPLLQPQALCALEGLLTQESPHERLQFRYGTVGTHKASIYHLRGLSTLSTRKPP